MQQWFDFRVTVRSDGISILVVDHMKIENSRGKHALICVSIYFILRTIQYFFEDLITLKTTLEHTFRICLGFIVTLFIILKSRSQVFVITNRNYRNIIFQILHRPLNCLQLYSYKYSQVTTRFFWSHWLDSNYELNYLELRLKSRLTCHFKQKRFICSVSRYVLHIICNIF